MEIYEISCPRCHYPGSNDPAQYAGPIEYTPDYGGVGLFSGYWCTHCWEFWFPEQFAEMYPDYDQSQDLNPEPGPEQPE